MSIKFNCSYYYLLLLPQLQRWLMKHTEAHCFLLLVAV